MAERLQIGATLIEAEARLGTSGSARVRLDDAEYQVTELERVGAELRFVFEGQRFSFQVLVTARELSVADGHGHYLAERIVPGADGAQQGGEGLVSKMPGKVLALLVVPGSTVKAGTPLLILEAMKMEHQVVAPADGVLNSYPVAEGQRVMPGDLLADLAAAV